VYIEKEWMEYESRAGRISLLRGLLFYRENCAGSPFKIYVQRRKNKKTMYIYTNNGNNSVCRVGVKFRVCGCDIQKSDPINRHKKKKKNKKFDMKGDQFHSSRN
jgi:hypothetical protein